MNRKRFTLVAAAAVLGAASLFAQTPATTPAPPRETPPAPGTPKNFNIPAVQKMELPNGMRVRLVPYGAVPKVHVRLTVQTGNVDEGPNETWLADLTGELIQQGSTTRTAEQVAREAASMGGSIDVGAGANQTNILGDVLSEAGPRFVELIADVVRNPRMPESEIARLKADLGRNLSIQRSQPQPLAQEKFSSVLFPNHAYGRLFPTPAMLEGYTIEQARAFYDRNFGAARATIYVVGRFDGPAVEAAIRRSFGDWKRGNPPSTITVQPVGRRGLYLIDRPGAVQSTLQIGLPVIDPTNPDYVPLVVTNSLLGGSFGSRITLNIRESKGYTYSPTSVFATRLGAGVWNEVADVTTNVTGPSIKEILYEIDRLRGEPPTDTELRGIQNFLAGTFVLRNSSRQGIAAQLAFLDLYGLGEDYLRNYVQRVYAVTPADIQRMTQRYIDPSKLAIVVVGDEKVIREQLTPYGEILR